MIPKWIWGGSFRVDAGSENLDAENIEALKLFFQQGRASVGMTLGGKIIAGVIIAITLATVAVAIWVN